VDKVDNGNKIRTECCPHRQGRAMWIRNDQQGPPVLFWEEIGGQGGVLLTLTNQTIYVNCGACFSAKRLAAQIVRLAHS